MADSEHSDLIAQFCGVTGADSSRAKLCLESAAWNLQLALASFYEDHDESMDRTSSREPSPEPVEPPKSPKHVTIASDKGKAPARSSGSGQQVLGPGKKPDSKENFVVEVFKAAKKHGAQVLEPGSEEAARHGAHGGGASWFRGTGYRLGCMSNDSQPVSAPSAAEGSAGRSGGAALPPPVSRVLKMWQDGFSIDDGPLHNYQDQESQEFLQAIRQGEIPRELLQEAEGAEVNLNMEDHRHEQFVAPARARLAFVGEGHRLGSVTPTLSRPVVPTPPREHTEKNAKEGVHLNEALPTTNIQIRLSDGTKLVAQMNHTHTVGDIRKYIVTARPEYEAATFILLTTFPHKELTDDKATLKDANLLNAVIVQRLK
ncbi:NSFL1 cofactor p47-like isoform X2 [Haemaphysalis longicornis]